MPPDSRWFHIIEVQQFSSEHLAELFRVADDMREAAFSGGSEMLRRRVMAALFYEPSTRTRLSFEAAMLRLGGGVVSTESAKEFSSAAKGETIEDTIRVVSSYSDVIVLRHHETGAAQRAARVSMKPVINAGDGTGQHPTQALLDIYTIQRELGGLEGVHVAMVGDLANGRTVRSLAKLLALFPKVRLTFVAHPLVPMRPDIHAYLAARKVPYLEQTDLAAVVPTVDVLYVTRVQRERFGERVADYEEACKAYRITPEVLEILPAHACIMHPLPRVDEISPEVDHDRRAAYFRQAENGLYVRMALLNLILAS